MNYAFHKLSLPEISAYNSLKLARLAQQLDSHTLFNQLCQLPQAEIEILRGLDEIFNAIERGESEQIQQIEWIYCLYNKAEWDKENLNRAHSTSESIWCTTLSNSWLKQTLFWLLFLEHSRSEQVLASSFVETFSVLQSWVTGRDKLIVQTLNAVAQNNYHTLAQLSAQYKITPQELFQQLQLPSNTNVGHKALEYAVEVFASQEQPEWLIRCFEQMSNYQQRQQVERLLSKVSVTTGSSLTELVSWLRRRYGHRNPNSHWHLLSSSAQSALLQWLNAATWEDFEKLANVLLSRLETRFQDAIPNSPNYRQLRYQINQLNMRKGFWSNYSERFERFRILLPSESAGWLRQELKRDIEILVPDGSEETEVCIFDFGDKYVVEFFRGAGSEMRLFNRQQNPQIEQKLFIAAGLSVKRLRYLGGEVHDHVYLWQVYAEKWLRQQGIFPNPGITRFQGLNPKFNQYNPKTGLAIPPVDKQKEREDKHIKWLFDIQKLEKEAREYCRKDGI